MTRPGNIGAGSILLPELEDAIYGTSETDVWAFIPVYIMLEQPLVEVNERVDSSVTDAEAEWNPDWKLLQMETIIDNTCASVLYAKWRHQNSQPFLLPYYCFIFARLTGPYWRRRRRRRVRKTGRRDLSLLTSLQSPQTLNGFIYEAALAFPGSASVIPIKYHNINH